MPTRQARHPFDDGTLPAPSLLWQTPSLTFAVFLVAMIAASADLDARQWTVLLVGLAIILAATVAGAGGLGPQRGRSTTIPLPAIDLIGAVLINLVGAQHLPPTVLLCALPALWMSFELGRTGVACAVGLTVLAAAGPYVAGLDLPSATVDLLATATPTCTIVVLSVISGALGAGLRESQARLQVSDLEARRVERLGQDRLVTMHGVLASVNAAVTVLLVDESPLCNAMAVEMAARAGLDPTDPTSAGSRVFDAGGATHVRADDQVTVRALRGEEFSDVLHWLGSPGHQIAMVASARQLVSDDGTALGAVVTAWDATDLMNSLRVREEFLTTVSHELRTPLTSVIGYLEMLTDLHQGSTRPDDRAGYMLGVVSRNARLLLDRITQLLSASDGPETGHEPVSTDVTALTRLAVQKHYVGAGAHRVELDIAVARGVSAEIDPTRFEQVVDNLVSNAIKFSSPGGRVVVQLQTDARRLRLRISDDGVGMTPDEQRQAFQRFYRADSATRNAVQGLGIGLGLVSTIVARHDGDIDIASAPGHGTTVTVELPLVTSAARSGRGASDGAGGSEDATTRRSH